MTENKLLEYLRKTVSILWYYEDSCEVNLDDVTIQGIIEAIKDTPEMRQFVMDKVNDPAYMCGT